MEIAQKIINSDAERDEHGRIVNPLDKQFRSLKLEYMEPVLKTSKAFLNLVAYARETHGATHGFSCEVESAFRVKRYAYSRCRLISVLKLADHSRMNVGKSRALATWMTDRDYFSGMDLARPISLEFSVKDCGLHHQKVSS